MRIFYNMLIINTFLLMLLQSISCENQSTQKNMTGSRDYGKFCCDTLICDLNDYFCCGRKECNIKVIEEKKVSGKYFPTNKCFKKIEREKRYKIIVVEDNIFKSSPLFIKYIVLDIENKGLVARGIGYPQKNECDMDMGKRGFGMEN